MQVEVLLVWIVQVSVKGPSKRKIRSIDAVDQISPFHYYLSYLIFFLYGLHSGKDTQAEILRFNNLLYTSVFFTYMCYSLVVRYPSCLYSLTNLTSRKVQVHRQLIEQSKHYEYFLLVHITIARVWFQNDGDDKNKSCFLKLLTLPCTKLSDHLPLFWEWNEKFCNWHSGDSFTSNLVLTVVWPLGNFLVKGRIHMKMVVF